MVVIKVAQDQALNTSGTDYWPPRGECHSHVCLPMELCYLTSRYSMWNLAFCIDQNLPDHFDAGRDQLVYVVFVEVADGWFVV